MPKPPDDPMDMAGLYSNPDALRRYQQLKATLRVLRNIDKSITSEKDPKVLVQGVCDHLTIDGHFHSAQIILLDPANNLIAVTASGDSPVNEGEIFAIAGQLQLADYRPDQRLQEIERLLNRFLPCPISGYFVNRDGVSAFTKSLKSETRTLGYFSVSVPAETLRNGIEIDLFHEIAEDIAYALQGLENRRINLRLAAAIEQCGESVVITDLHPRIEYVNPAFTRITGFSAEEVIDKNPSILKSGEHDREFYAGMWEKLLGGEVWSGLLKNRTKDGRLIQEEAIISPIKDDGGKATGYVAIKRDITERLKWERSLLNSQKLQSIGTLAGGIAHDFNNILTGILGNLSYLKKYEMEPDHPGHESVQKTLEAAYRARDLVDQILQFSRPNREEIVPVAAEPVILEVLQFLNSSKPENVTFAFVPSSRQHRFLGAPTKFYQILLNLLSNAIHAIGHEAGVISIEVSEESMQALQGEDWKLPEGAGYIVTRVSDTGCGMQDSVRERIFDPFFTTRESPTGVGLGLAVVHNIVRSFKGFIRVESEVGNGSTFYIYLPKA